MIYQFVYIVNENQITNHFLNIVRDSGRTEVGGTNSSITWSNIVNSAYYNINAYK